MDHGLKLLIPCLEILEIEVCNILYNPGNIGKQTVSVFCYPGNIGNLFFHFPDILEILEIWFFCILGFSQKKTRAEISRRMHRRMSRDLSYETDSWPKTKTVFSQCFYVVHHFHIFWDVVFFYAQYRNDISTSAVIQSTHAA